MIKISFILINYLSHNIDVKLKLDFKDKFGPNNFKKNDWKYKKMVWNKEI